MLRRLWMVLALVTAMGAWAETNIPPVRAKICLIVGNYDNCCSGHPTAMGGIFGVRAPTDWQYVFSGSDTIHDGTTCWGWSIDGGGLIFTTNFVNRAVSSNVSMIVWYAPYEDWQYPAGSFPSGLYDQKWAAVRLATAKGILVFGPHFDNSGSYIDQLWIKCPPCFVGVSGGYPDSTRGSTYGPTAEFMDCKQTGDIAQSWANQAAAARMASIMDFHTNYNTFDTRAYARQTTFDYPQWNQDIGYGFIGMTNRTGDPDGAYWSDLAGVDRQPPLETWMVKTNGRYNFFWENYLQSGWQSTVIKLNGSIIFEGPGSNIVYTAMYNLFGTNNYYDVNLNGWRPPSSVTYSGTNVFHFHTRVGGVLSADTPYSVLTYVE